MKDRLDRLEEELIGHLNNYAKALQEIDEKHDDLTQITDQKELVELASLETTVVVLQGILARIKEININVFFFVIHFFFLSSRL